MATSNLEYLNETLGTMEKYLANKQVQSVDQTLDAAQRKSASKEVTRTTKSIQKQHTGFYSEPFYAHQVFISRYFSA